jgi:hypothetical protein
MGGGKVEKGKGKMGNSESVRVGDWFCGGERRGAGSRSDSNRAAIGSADSNFGNSA